MSLEVRTIERMVGRYVGILESVKDVRCRLEQWGFDVAAEISVAKSVEVGLRELRVGGREVI